MYANRGRFPLANIPGSTERNPVLDTEIIKPVAHSTTAPCIDEWDVALATGRLASDFVQKLPSSNSLLNSRDINNAVILTPSFGHRRDAEQLQFASSRVNAGRHSLNNESPQSYAREFHIRLCYDELR